MASSRSSASTSPGSYSTTAFSEARLTVAFMTPFFRVRVVCMLWAQAAQVIPLMEMVFLLVWLFFSTGFSTGLPLIKLYLILIYWEV